MHVVEAVNGHRGGVNHRLFPGAPSRRCLRRVTATPGASFSAWTGAWTGIPRIPRVMCAFVACHVRHRCRPGVCCGRACFF